MDLIDCLSVLSVLKEYYSPEGTDEQLAPVCTLAVNELLPRVKNESVYSDARLVSLAAAMANYRLCAKKVRNSDGVTSFKAGDVTVSVSAAALMEQAEKDRKDAMLAALPLLKDDEFIFRQVAV